MLESVRRRVAVAVPRAELVLTAVTTLSFGWLLVNDLLHPLAVFLLQLYLAF